MQTTIPRLLQALTERLRQGPLTLAIDGRAAAGKTTLACQLQQHFGAAVIHMDDFFLPAELRTASRLQTPGGNVHYERFLQEVAPALQAGTSICHRKYDCHQAAYLPAPVCQPASRLTIVEGSYSLHPRLRFLYGLSVFCTISPALQRQRLAARNPAALDAFLTRWIPLEEQYIAATAPMENCDFVIFCGESCPFSPEHPRFS